MQIKKQQLKLGMDQWTGSKLGKEYVRLDESQARIKIAERNIKNIRYANDTTLMTESEEELKSLLMKINEENEKAGLKLSI